MSRQAVTSPDAAPVIGPYSPAITSGSFLFLSGQIPLDPATGELVAGDVRAQARRVLDNIGGLLRAGGADFAHVVKSTVFLADLGDFAAVNEIYSTYFSEPYPARSTVQVARLPRDVRIEIEVIAVLD
jgi:2-iminobutanoate/2-iminopropanoate deaminase